MRFSWTGLLLAPLLVPVLFSAATATAFTGNSPALFFLMVLLASGIVSYGTTICLFLPCLLVLSLWRRVTWWQVSLLGLGLGAAVCIPLTLMDWPGSGPNSGPATESYLSYLLHWASDPMSAMYPLAGMVTAGLYWALGTWRRGRSAATAPGAAV